MKKILLFFIATIGMIACGSEEVLENEVLNGNWRLNTIVNLENNQSRFPKNSSGEEEESDLYQIHFISPSSFKGKTMANTFEGVYSKNNNSINFEINRISEVLDPSESDSYFFQNSIENTSSYEISNNQLKLFTSDHCLVFNVIQL
ncbi:hypothetical protein AB4865_01355 [Capnocytophaga sp. ARDL2]|uniref:hypothetical protein n=1 Tax=Capnocytophaga sp. ARDL2 TaxID=3238809 RepID=UPI0035585E2D